MQIGFVSRATESIYSRADSRVTGKYRWRKSHYLSLLYLLQSKAYVCSDIDGKYPWVTPYQNRENMSVNQCLEVGSRPGTLSLIEQQFYCGGVHSTSPEKMVDGP